MKFIDVIAAAVIGLGIGVAGDAEAPKPAPAEQPGVEKGCTHPDKEYGGLPLAVCVGEPRALAVCGYPYGFLAGGVEWQCVVTLAREECDSPFLPARIVCLPAEPEQSDAF